MGPKENKNFLDKTDEGVPCVNIDKSYNKNLLDFQIGSDKFKAGITCDFYLWLLLADDGTNTAGAELNIPAKLDLWNGKMVKEVLKVNVKAYSYFNEDASCEDDGGLDDPRSMETGCAPITVIGKKPLVIRGEADLKLMGESIITKKFCKKLMGGDSFSLLQGNSSMTPKRKLALALQAFRRAWGESSGRRRRKKKSTKL